MKFRGIIVKTKDSHYLVLASDGTYHKVPLSQHKSARVGSEIEFTVNNWHRYLRPALLVASILVFALGLSLFRQAGIPPAFAYVSLDINPSVELKVDQSLKVISAHPLNKDAENLLSQINISGQQLYASVNAIVAEAVYEGFLKAGQKNYVLSTITMEDTSAKDTDYEALAGELNSAVQNKGIEVELLVLAADNKLHQEAKTKGLSTGKLMVYREAEEAGQRVTLEQVKENSISNLVDKYKIKLVPNEKRLIIKADKPSGKDGTGRKDRTPSDNDRPGNNERDSAPGKMEGKEDKNNNYNIDSNSNGKGDHDSRGGSNDNGDNESRGRGRDRGSSNGHGNNGSRDTDSRNGKGDSDSRGKDSSSGNGESGSKDKDSSIIDGHTKGKNDENEPDRNDKPDSEQRESGEMSDSDRDNRDSGSKQNSR